MSKFLENMKGKIKNLPNLFVKRLIKIKILGDLIEFTFPSILSSHSLKGFLEDLIIKINDDIVYDIRIFPSDFDVKLNNKLYQNQELSEIYYRSLKMGDKLEITIPNRFSLSTGNHKIVIETPSSGKKVSFVRNISSSSEKPEKSEPQLVQREAYRRCPYCSKEILDPNQIICESCGSELEK